MNINILGTNYEIVRKKYTDEKFLQENSLVGYCDYTLKIICIVDLSSFPNMEKEKQEKCHMMELETIRHEIIHAFLNESGLQDSSNQFDGAWVKNEEMVDWFAIQLPKISKAIDTACQYYDDFIKTGPICS